jgi:hypothetical protein
MTRTITFRQSDVVRLIKAARAGGITHPRVSVESSGRITVSAGSPADEQPNEWDEVSAPSSPPAPQPHRKSTTGRKSATK